MTDSCTRNPEEQFVRDLDALLILSAVRSWKDSPPRGGEYFHRVTADSIRRAHRDGVDVEAHWACRSADDAPDWEVVRVAPAADG